MRLRRWLVGFFLMSACDGGGEAITGNQPPIANAGPDQRVAVGSVVTLDGGASNDPDRQVLHFSWAFDSKPSASAASLSAATTVFPTFTADRDGSYLVRLVVNDGQEDSVADVVMVTAVYENIAPVANAGPDQNVTTGSRVTLDGGASSDSDGDLLTYAWSFAAKPEGSTAALSDASAVKPSFTADRDGVYAISLVVTDGALASPADSVTVTAATLNSAPIANAGIDQNVATGSVVMLDGSASSDANGDLLTFRWSFTSKPTGSTAVLASPDGVRPTFMADRDGSYMIGLVVNDGTVDSATDTVVVIAATLNVAPVANAGIDQNVAAGSLVMLDGSSSSDGDSNLLTYAWSFTAKPAGSAATLSSATAVNPTFTADRDGSYVLRLVVNDGIVDSAADFVTVTATTANAAPVANAGLDQNVAAGSLVTLDGSASSDADGDSLTYAWSFTTKPAGSTTSLSSATAVKPTFTADRDGSYVLRLVVNDGNVDSTADSVTVTATTANAAPVANAGVDQNVAVGSLVTLDGSASSDADGDLLTYAWSFTAKPAGSAAVLSSATAVKPTFTADLDGSYVIRLVVNDGSVDSATDFVSVSAAVANLAPVANAGIDRTSLTGWVVALDGTASSDPNGDALAYAWSFTAKPTGSTAVLSDANAAKPTFLADRDGDYVIRLVVDDGTLASAPDSVTITASLFPQNLAPVANAGPDQFVVTGSSATLDGSASEDANGDALNYAWSFSTKPDGSNAVLSNDTDVTASFTADRDGAYVIRLVVDDGNASTVDFVTVTADASGNAVPAAVAGLDQNVLTGSPVMVDASASTDANGDPLTYAWSFTAKPAGSSAVLSNATIVRPTFIPDRDGSYVISLVVNDGQANSAADSLTITASVFNVEPMSNAGPDRYAVTGSPVTLDGSASSDANGDALTYQWLFLVRPEGSVVELSSRFVAMPTFTPDRDGRYMISLAVADGVLSSRLDYVDVTARTQNVEPVANAGLDQQVVTGSRVTLDGSASSDVNGDSLTYAWLVTAKPEGSTAVLSSATSARPTFTADRDGTYVINLVVHDGTLTGTADAVTIIATATTAPIRIPRTGQTVSFFAGDDGNLELGEPWPSPRLVDRGDGTVSDRLTGLMWLKDTNCIGTAYPSYDHDSWGGVGDGDGHVSWQHALDFVKGMNAGTYSACAAGYSDWRMPNVRELRSLVDYGRFSPALPEGHPFLPGTNGFVGWSSTTSEDPGRAWAWSMGDASIQASEKWGPVALWPVRTEQSRAPATPAQTGQTTCWDGLGAVIACSGTGQDADVRAGLVWPAPRFTVGTGAEEGCVTDHLTGFVWSASPSPSIWIWDEALAYATDATMCGRTDWRIPNVSELETLFSAGVGASYVLDHGFTNIVEDEHWTSTSHPCALGCLGWAMVGGPSGGFGAAPKGWVVVQTLLVAGP